MVDSGAFRAAFQDQMSSGTGDRETVRTAENTNVS